MCDPKLVNLSNYYVDEAGDGVLFGKKRKIIINTPGCSRFFLLGVLEVPHPGKLAEDLENLRSDIVEDPYLQHIPSIALESRKTASLFHATDDSPEVRERVFRLLRCQENLRFFTVVKDKLRVLDYVQSRNQSDPNYAYHPYELYDFTVRLLFKDRLHSKDFYNITFAKLGPKDREIALKNNLMAARERFSKQHGIEPQSEVVFSSKMPQRDPCLQAADYFLWAIQRLYERRQDRYVKYMHESIKLVHDIDDTRERPYGVYYNKSNPLSLDVIEGRL